MGNKYTNMTNNGNTDVVRVRGRTHVHISGTWGGATVKLQYQDPSDTWRDIVNASWTTDCDDVLDFTDRIDTPVRANVSGAEGASLHIDIRGGH